ncbi:MAG TPA: cytochrome c3 family protein [Blastocatellia bacterium]|nr:cytochrome c3 family protein [Blastocatellia bacterium]
MLKRFSLFIFAVIVMSLTLRGNSDALGSQEDLAAFKDNACVTCHSRVSSPLGMSNRYLDWHLSAHKDKGVACDKCHGGDPSIRDEKKAHAAVLGPSLLESRLHPMKLPETCGACHNSVVTSFVGSKHYQRLKDSSIGPSCSTCHSHMASNVIRDPDETQELCARCHDTLNGIIPRRPEIPAKANEVMQSIKRANSMVIWANSLVDEGQKKKIDVAAEAEQMKAVRQTMSEAKVGWHAFNLEAVRAKADAAFESALKVKDRLMKKLGYA